MAVSDAHVFPGFLTPVLTQLFFPKPPNTFLTFFCRGKGRKYARKKVCLNLGLNSQPSGHEYDTLTTEPPGRGPHYGKGECSWNQYFLLFLQYFLTYERHLICCLRLLSIWTKLEFCHLIKGKASIKFGNKFHKTANI